MTVITAAGGAHVFLVVVGVVVVVAAVYRTRALVVIYVGARGQCQKVSSPTVTTRRTDDNVISCRTLVLFVSLSSLLYKTHQTIVSLIRSHIPARVMLMYTLLLKYVYIYLFGNFCVRYIFSSLLTRKSLSNAFTRARTS